MPVILVAKHRDQHSFIAPPPEPQQDRVGAAILLTVNSKNNYSQSAQVKK